MASPRRAALMEKLKKARASGVGNNFRDGKYRLAVKKMGLEDGFKGTRFQASFVVVNSMKVPVIGLGGGGKTGLEKGKVFDISPLPVGSTGDWLCMDLDKEDQPGAGNVKRFIQELFNAKSLEDDEYIETLAELADIDENGDALKEPKNPGKGMLIDMETVRLITKAKQQEIVVCNFSHVPDASYDQNAIAKWIDDIAAIQQAQAQALAAQAQQALPAGNMQQPTA